MMSTDARGRIVVGYRVRIVSKYNTLYDPKEVDETRSGAYRRAIEWGEGKWGSEVFQAMLKGRQISMFAIPIMIDDPAQMTMEI